MTCISENTDCEAQQEALSRVWQELGGAISAGESEGVFSALKMGVNKKTSSFVGH